MGRFVNAASSAFQVALNSEIYVDKSGLLSYTNKVLDTKQALICNSRPRRFGKSTAVDMLVAYYSKGCDSRQLFDGLEIAEKEDYLEHLNRYNVIQFDVQWCKGPAKGADGIVAYIERTVVGELQEVYPGVLPQSVSSISDAMSCIHAATGDKFMIIIDEWDVLIREDAENQAVQEEYIGFLRSLFKGSEATKCLHLAYLTGILPIKKVKTQSALNNFEEFTMLDAGILRPYIGFTEEEVTKLCERYGKDFDEVKRWYDGYLLGGAHIYNPKAVISVMMRGDFQSYWSKTGTYESIIPLINMDFDGLKTTVLEMLSGAAVPVDVSYFQNDMVTFADQDDVLTLLAHLGYLAYDQRRQTVCIPNEEIRQEFAAAVRRNKWNEFFTFQRVSKELLEATWNMDGEAVAAGIERIHQEYTSVITYNNENSLSSVLSIAYLSAMQYYFKPIREMPAGRGFADFVFLPKMEYAKECPALLVELKWNKGIQTAIGQIKERKYPDALAQYQGDILLVGISYDKKSKEHQCVMERL